MARIEKTITIDRSPDDVWRVVGDFGAISTWLPAIAASSFGDGVRECTLEGGGTLREEIVERDDAARRYAYRITASPLPLEHHRASMSVEPDGAGSRVTWITEIHPDELAGSMEPVLEEGLKALKTHLESA
jgi:carbon monoxide dehydrogenase subunit G